MKNTVFLLFVFLIDINYAQTIEGSWQGKLSVQGQKLSTIFHIEKQNNRYTATMDSPQQMAYGIPLDSVCYRNGQLSLLQTNADIRYTAALKNDTLIEGTFTQRGMEIPLSLTPFAQPKRPQTPQPPFPYHIEEITFTNPKNDIQLAGTLTMPKGKKQVPAVVLVSGSGPQNRNEEIFDHQPFWVIADYLTRNGIAVLRYDDRGTADSKGDFSKSNTFDFANDAQAAYQYLKNRKGISNIGIIGHSEGGIIATILASRQTADFIVMMAASGIRGDRLLALQREKMEALKGVSALYTQQRQQIFREVNQLVLDSTLPLQEIKQKSWAVLHKHWKNSVPEQQLRQVHQQLTSDWMIAFVRLDPTTYISQIACPVLVLNGEKDVQVPYRENTTAIKTALQKARNRHFNIKTYPQLNHLFQKAQTGLPDEYDNIKQTIAPQVLEDMEEWIHQLK